MFKLVRADEFGQTLDLRPRSLEPWSAQVVERASALPRGARPVAPPRGRPGPRRPIEVDPAKLADILTNLFVNAIKFTPDGGTIRIAAQAYDGDPDWVRVQVDDEGVGVHPGDQPHLFEPFFTGFDTLHHSSGDYQFGKRGSAWASAWSRPSSSSTAGRVEIQSDPGQGSTFGFVLPRGSSRRAARSTRPSDPPGDRRHRRWRPLTPAERSGRRRPFDHVRVEDCPGGPSSRSSARLSMYSRR